MISPRLTPRIRELDEPVQAILRGEFKAELVRSAARAAGMRQMQEDALAKLQAGVTTLEEVLRVVPISALPSSGCPQCGREISPAFRFCPYCGTRRETGASAAPSLAIPNGVLSS